MLQHALDDAIRAASVLGDLFQITSQHPDRLVDLGTLVFAKCNKSGGGGLPFRARPEITESTFDRVRYGFTTCLGYHVVVVIDIEPIRERFRRWPRFSMNGAVVWLQRQRRSPRVMGGSRRSRWRLGLRRARSGGA